MGLPRRLKEGHVRDFAVQRPGGQGSPSGPVWPHPGLTLPGRGDLQEVRPARAHSLLFLAFPTSLAPGVQAALPGLGGVGRGAPWLREAPSEKERGSQISLDLLEERWTHSIWQLVPRGHALPSGRAPDR